MAGADERNPFMGFCNRLMFILVFGLVLGGTWEATWAASLPSQKDVRQLEVNMTSHELLQMARLDQGNANQDNANRDNVNQDNARAAGVSERAASTGGALSSEKPEAWQDDELPEEAPFPDPLEPMNRAFFTFNDKAYFWFFKPVAEGYNTVMPEVLRLSIKNFFTNLSMPIRLVSCLLQGKIKGVGITLVRFVVNSSAGFLGFQDVAKLALDYPVQDEDLGQVFAFYGIGPGFYLNLPFLGASSLRDTTGWVAGLYLNPWDYIVEDFWPNMGGRAFDMMNKTSLRVGEYEALKDAALDPYVAMRDAYFQYRLNQIEK